MNHLCTDQAIALIKKNPGKYQTAESLSNLLSPVDIRFQGKSTTIEEGIKTWHLSAK